MIERSELSRVLNLRDLVLFHVVAIIGLRWLLTAAKTGPSSILLWLAAVLFFFIPQGLAVLELAARMPEEGGIYVWAREAFGPLHGFICGWAYWVNNLIYYPSLIFFIAGNAVFVLGRQHLGLADNSAYQLTFSLGALWLALGINIVGLRAGRWVQNTGAAANWAAAALLIGLGAAAWAFGQGRNPLAGGSLLPDLGGSGLAFWSTLCFALAGLELAPVMSGETRDPQRSLPRSILIAAPIIAGIYIVGTLAVLAAFPATEVNVVSGVVEAIGQVGERFGLPLTRLAALLIVLTGLGGIGAWLAGTARIPFVVGLDRYLPPALGKIHPRWKTPHVALIVQGLGATVFILMAGLHGTIEEAYLILVETTIIVYFVPYLYMFAALPILRRRAGRSLSPGFIVPGGTVGVALVALSGLATTVTAIILSTIPSEEVTSPTTFVGKVLGGAVALLAVGLIFYFRGRRADRPATRT